MKVWERGCAKKFLKPQAIQMALCKFWPPCPRRRTVAREARSQTHNFGWVHATCAGHATLPLAPDDSGARHDKAEQSDQQVDVNRA